DGNVHAADIGVLTAIEVTRGTTDTTFGPGQFVRRDQVASFLVRAVAWAQGVDVDSLQVASTRFADIAGNSHAGNINAAADLGLVNGTTDTTYTPGASTRRDQMASVLVRALDVLHADPEPAPSPSPVLAAPSQVVVVGRDTSAEVSWQPSSHPQASGYVVSQSSAASGPWETVTTAAVTDTTFTATGLANGDTYYFTVATQAGGDLSEPSAPTAVIPGATVEAELGERTSLVAPGEVVGVEAGSDDLSLVLSLDAAAHTPAVGDHLVVQPTAGLTDGLIATVASAAPPLGGVARVEVVEAALDEAFPAMTMDIDIPITMTVSPVDEAAPAAAASSGPELMSFSPGDFACEDASGVTVNSEDLWDTSSPIPIDINFAHMRAIQQFDAGDPLLGRDPFLLLQVSGQAVTSIDVQAKTGFSCTITTQFEQRNRLRATIGFVSGVPITLNLDPAFTFGVSAPGSIGFEQRRSFAFTLSSTDGNSLEDDFSHTADPAEFNADVKVTADVFAGGDLSLVFGSGSEAGMYGDFGPGVDAVVDTDDHDCLVVNGDLRANFGVRLQAWVKRWNHQLADLSVPKTELTRRCGLPDPEPEPDPEPLGSDAVAAGLRHTCALRQGGTVACWGWNVTGQLGDDTNTDRLTPVAVHGLNDALALTAGSAHTCALRQGGTVACWGRNASGQLGDDTNTDRLTPVAVHGLNDALALTAGSAHTCALRQGGTVACWGRNASGQLGDDTTTDRLTPVAVQGLDDAVGLTAGGGHTCALRGGDTVACWGWNEFGQLGDDTTTDRLIPVAVHGLDDVVALIAGGGHTCALREGDTVACWGDNLSGQLGDDTNTDRLTPVAV
ncbi:MAG: S-layer homology domain-containing protein, partial [Egibacteraceae bacterium]